MNKQLILLPGDSNAAPALVIGGRGPSTDQSRSISSDLRCFCKATDYYYYYYFSRRKLLFFRIFFFGLFVCFPLLSRTQDLPIGRSGNLVQSLFDAGPTLSAVIKGSPSEPSVRDVVVSLDGMNFFVCQDPEPHVDIRHFP